MHPGIFENEKLTQRKVTHLKTMSKTTRANLARVREERVGEPKIATEILPDGFTHLQEAELFRIDCPSPPSPNSLHGVKRVSSLLDQRDCN